MASIRLMRDFDVKFNEIAKKTKEKGHLKTQAKANL